MPDVIVRWNGRRVICVKNRSFPQQRVVQVFRDVAGFLRRAGQMSAATGFGAPAKPNTRRTPLPRLDEAQGARYQRTRRPENAAVRLLNSRAVASQRKRQRRNDTRQSSSQRVVRSYRGSTPSRRRDRRLIFITCWAGGAMPADNEDEKREARRKPLPGYHTLFGVQPPHVQSDGAGFVSRPSVNCHQSSGRGFQCRLESQSYKNSDGAPSPNSISVEVSRASSYLLSPFDACNPLLSRPVNG